MGTWPCELVYCWPASGWYWALDWYWPLDWDWPLGWGSPGWRKRLCSSMGAGAALTVLLRDQITELAIVPLFPSADDSGEGGVGRGEG